MSDSIRNRIVTFMPLVALLVCSLVVIQTGKTLALSPTVPEKQSGNERKLVKSTWRNEPVKVKKVKVKKGDIVLGQKFVDDDDDWLAGLTLSVKNTSSKDILGVDVSLTLFTKEGGDK